MVGAVDKSLILSMQPRNSLPASLITLNTLLDNLELKLPKKSRIGALVAVA